MVGVVAYDKNASLNYLQEKFGQKGKKMSFGPKKQKEKKHRKNNVQSFH